jgi:hypothetical protein
MNLSFQQNVEKQAFTLILPQNTIRKDYSSSLDYEHAISDIMASVSLE